MAQPIKIFEFTYKDIFNLCRFKSFDSGMNRIYREKSGGFEPSNLKSLVLFLARHGSKDFQKEIMNSILDTETNHKVDQ